MDKQALEELARQFLSTSGQRAGAIPDPAASAAPTATASQAAAAPQVAEATPPTVTSPPPKPPSSATAPSLAAVPAETAVRAATDTTPQPATRAWHEDWRLRSAAIGAAAFLAGYVISDLGSASKDPSLGAIARAVQAARSEAADELNQVRTRAAAALREAEQSAAAARAARAEADRATAELAAAQTLRFESDRIIVAATALAAAANAGRGFSSELAAARQLAGDAPRLTAALNSLSAFAAGVPSREMLADAFGSATRRAQTLGEDAMQYSWGGWILAHLTGGTGADQAARARIIATARMELGRGDLIRAAEALSRLDDVARVAVEPWISSARARAALEAVTDRVTAALVLRADQVP
jgi:hypothetical protein